MTVTPVVICAMTIIATDNMSHANVIAVENVHAIHVAEINKKLMINLKMIKKLVNKILQLQLKIRSYET
jgi:hypothetical protein